MAAEKIWVPLSDDEVLERSKKLTDLLIEENELAVEKQRVGALVKTRTDKIAELKVELIQTIRLKGEWREDNRQVALFRDFMAGPSGAPVRSTLETVRERAESLERQVTGEVKEEKETKKRSRAASEKVDA